MTIEIETYIKSLAAEYLGLIRLMTSHSYHSEDERAALSSQRTWVRNELVRVLGDDYKRPFDMKRYCQDLLSS